MEKMDAALKGYYEEINKMYGKNIFHTSYPVLYDYIRKNSDSLVDILYAAFELRENKDIINLRKSLDTLGDMFNAGNIKGIYIAFKQLEELSKTIANAHKGATIAQLGIGLSGPSATFSPIKLSDKKVINMTFLTKLANFGIQERLSKQYRIKNY